MLKPKTIAKYSNVPTAFRDFKNVEWKVGNAVIDASQFNEGDVIAPFTAIQMNPDTKLYELVEEYTGEGEAPEIVGGLVTGPQPVFVGTENPMVSGIRKAALIEERCNGVTDAFKEATKGRLTFDV